MNVLLTLALSCTKYNMFQVENEKKQEILV